MINRAPTAHILVSSAAAVLCVVPLFDLLGYESSAAMAVVLGLVTLVRTTRDTATTGPFGHPRGPIEGFAAGLPRQLGLAVPPLLILSLNALRVRNCDPWAGLVWWALLPVITIIWAHGLGWVCRGLSRWPLGLGLGLLAVHTALFVYRLVVEPPIVGFHWLFGWFAGSIYDEALSVPRSLVWYRGLQLTELVAALAALELFWRRRRGLPQRWPAQLLIVALLGVIIGHSAKQRAGIAIDRAFIAERLGSVATSAHFRVLYDARALEPAQVRALLDDHEFRYAELQAYLGTDPVAFHGDRLDVYVYPNHQTQQQLFGSRRTFVARPWTYEMHIRWDRVGDTVVAHELAHLFSAPFGGGPLRLATRGGLIPDIGLVEGLALAADWPPSELDPHEAAAAMRKLGIAPDVRDTFRPWGFWQQPAGKAYTLMGSFVRHLIDTYGIDAFAKVYARGDFEAVYGRPVEALITEWEQMVDGLQIDEARLELAQLRYARGSIFQKTCARTLAELRRQAEGAEAQGDWAKALSLRQQISHHQGDDPQGQVEIAALLVALGRHDDAIALLDGLRGRDDASASPADPTATPPKLQPAMQARVEELRGDVLWRAGRLPEAAQAYGGCLGLGIDDADRRRVEVKTTATLSPDPQLAALLYAYMLDDTRRSAQLFVATELTRTRPAHPLGPYLLGLQLSAIHEHAEAIPRLEGPPGLLTEPSLDERRRELLADALWRTGQLDRAEAEWQQLLHARSSRTRALAREGIDRVRFHRTQARLGG